MSPEHEEKEVRDGKVSLPVTSVKAGQRKSRGLKLNQVSRNQSTKKEGNVTKEERKRGTGEEQRARKNMEYKKKGC